MLDLVDGVLDVIDEPSDIDDATAAAFIKKVKRVNQFVHQRRNGIGERELKSGFHGHFLYDEHLTWSCDRNHTTNGYLSMGGPPSVGETYGTMVMVAEVLNLPAAGANETVRITMPPLAGGVGGAV